VIVNIEFRAGTNIRTRKSFTIKGAVFMNRLTAMTAIAFLFSLPLSAQTVDEIIAKNIAAKGGLAKLKTVQSVRMTGDFDTGSMQAGFTQSYKRPMKARLDVSIQGLTMTRAYDGQKGWQIVPFTGKKDPEPMTSEETKNTRETADFDGPLVDYKAKGSAVELVGKEKVAGADAYHLKVTLKEGEVSDLYLDAKTFLGRKAVTRKAAPGSEAEVESTFGDYKEVDGLMFPFSIEQRHVGGGDAGAVQKITFKKIEVNAPIEDSFFTMPAVAATPK
jgi:outer membrane lipoprotein-sorting protein